MFSIVDLIELTTFGQNGFGTAILLTCYPLILQHFEILILVLDKVVKRLCPENDICKWVLKFKNDI